MTGRDFLYYVWPRTGRLVRPALVTLVGSARSLAGLPQSQSRSAIGYGYLPVKDDPLIDVPL